MLLLEYMAAAVKLTDTDTATTKVHTVNLVDVQFDIKNDKRTNKTRLAVNEFDKIQRTKSDVKERIPIHSQLSHSVSVQFFTCVQFVKP